MLPQRLTVGLVLGVTGAATVAAHDYFWLGVLLLGLAALYVAKGIVEWRDR